MDSQNIFNVFGEQIKTENTEILDNLEQIKTENTEILNKLERTDKINNAINVEKYYINFNRRRIVNVKPSIDKHDVVIKEEIEKPLKLSNNIDIVDSSDPNIKNSLNVKGRRISDVSKGVYPFDVVVKVQLEEINSNFENLKKNLEIFKLNSYDKFVTEMNEFKKDYEKFLLNNYADFVTEMQSFKNDYNSFKQKTNDFVTEMHEFKDSIVFENK